MYSCTHHKYHHHSLQIPSSLTTIVVHPRAHPPHHYSVPPRQIHTHTRTHQRPPPKTQVQHIHSQYTHTLTAYTITTTVIKHTTRSHTYHHYLYTHTQITHTHKLHIGVLRTHIHTHTNFTHTHTHTRTQSHIHTNYTHTHTQITHTHTHTHTHTKYTISCVSISRAPISLVHQSLEH